MRAHILVYRSDPQRTTTRGCFPDRTCRLPEPLDPVLEEFVPVRRRPVYTVRNNTEKEKY